MTKTDSVSEHKWPLPKKPFAKKSKSVSFDTFTRQIHFLHHIPPALLHEDIYELRIIPIDNTNSPVQLNMIECPPYCSIDYLVVQITDHFGESLEECILGRLVVFNRDYEKQLIVRYTVDSWLSFTDASGKYSDSLDGKNLDYFDFVLTIPYSIQELRKPFRIEMAIELKMGQDVFWNNNKGLNFQYDLKYEPIDC